MERRKGPKCPLGLELGSEESPMLGRKLLMLALGVLTNRLGVGNNSRSGPKLLVESDARKRASAALTSASERLIEGAPARGARRHLAAQPRGSLKRTKDGQSVSETAANHFQRHSKKMRRVRATALWRS